MELPSAFKDFKVLLVELKPLDRGYFASVGLNNPPVNAMSKQLWDELLVLLITCEKTSEIRGLLFYSALTRPLFTAGNDLMELYAPKTTEKRYYDFWIAQTTFLARLYRTPLATVACCQGYVPAGGCGLALCCDYRILTSDLPNSSIGLNEVQIGILVPKFWAKLFLLNTGNKGEIYLTTGRMVGAEDAVNLGLVHELASKEDLLRVGEERIEQILTPADKGRQLTKHLMRNAFGEEWEAFGPEEARLAWQQLSSPEIVKALGAAMKQLFGGKKKSKI